LVLSTSAAAQAPTKPIISTGTIVGVIVGAVAAVGVVTYLVIHESSKKRTITGCVNSRENGMVVTDDNDKRLYALSGDTAGIKPGERVTLKGRKIKPKDAGTPLLWETTRMAKNLGVCQP
jgi:hypothetical protein